MKFELVKKVPVVELNGKKCFVDTGYPGVGTALNPSVQEFFGIPGLCVAGVGSLKRYTKFDYLNCEITTSDEPITLEGGDAMPMEIRENCKWPGWLVKMTVGGVEGMYYIDTGAAYSYVHNLPSQFQAAEEAEDCGFSGKSFKAPMRRVPCEFAGHQFEILCGDAKDNPEYVPNEGVIGYDFFNNFAVVVDRTAGKMTFVKKQT
ncbi:MAG: hypothetical protein IKO55_17830 [Kiritimatiellae bacterium]|nr:hypothetical protein [Kiritimatiellia bacterium]